MRTSSNCIISLPLWSHSQLHASFNCRHLCFFSSRQNHILNEQALPQIPYMEARFVTSSLSRTHIPPTCQYDFPYPQCKKGVKTGEAFWKPYKFEFLIKLILYSTCIRQYRERSKHSKRGCSGASVFTRVFGRFFGERMAQGRTHPSLASLSEMDCG